MAGPHAHTLIRDCCNKLYVHSGSGDRGQSSVCREKTHHQHISAVSWCRHKASQVTSEEGAAPPVDTSVHHSPFIQFVLHGFALPVTGDNLDLVHLHQVGHLSELHVVQDKRPHVVTEPVGVERTLQDRRTHAQLEHRPQTRAEFIHSFAAAAEMTNIWLAPERTHAASGQRRRRTQTRKTWSIMISFFKKKLFFLLQIITECLSESGAAYRIKKGSSSSAHYLIFIIFIYHFILVTI